MPRETNAAKRERAIEVCERLNRRYGPVECFLDYESPYRLVISVLLSAQTTDAQVNKVTPELFRRWPTPADLAAATPGQVAEVIRSIGFYKSKARHAVEAAHAREPPCAPHEALAQDARGRAAQDRAGPAQDSAEGVLARRQPPVDQVLPRDMQRQGTQVRRVPVGRHLPELPGGVARALSSVCGVFADAEPMSCPVLAR